MAAFAKGRDCHKALRGAPRFLVQLAGLMVLTLGNPSFAATSGAAAQEPAAEQTKDPGSQTTIRTTVRQVLVDVVVTDRKNHPITGLQRDDFYVLEDGSNYYKLAYSPSDTTFDGRLRKISVQLYHGSYHLAYRHSYLADDSVVEQNAANAAIMRLQVALRRGAPLAPELPLQARITPQGKAQAPTKEEIAQLAQFPAYASRKKWDGLKIQRYAIEYEVPGSQVALESAEDGGMRARFEILMGVYDQESQTMFGYRSPLEKVYSVKNAEQTRKESFRL